ncbi:phospholipase D-like domain-containing protein DpdK [Streptomyces hainanensis]|uniref:Phosphatidylserine/phosphatidylglycerophosphate/ cardiolipin synthase family protein n=1 Tax=Streptomyces hainanensis TaxID=402648 RepID=A0A4V2Y464_9ACTN|nr:phospholipase D-like domain-containing protein DpdK [Streptomyces hainanensis]TDC79155.1 phosphatidylserine/phosphatidylglycerophosphate/cardiolipin synthase family protein [Streptomyces hainanensis]
MLERTVRTGAGTGLRADTLLASALLAELVAPGPDLWVVSAWISDVEILDNSYAGFSAILDERVGTTCRLSEMLGMIANAGSRLHIVTRPGAHNEAFVSRVRAAMRDPRPLHVEFDAEVHEKTMCGRDWILSGSMNFTVNGLGSSKEQVTYTVGGGKAAQAHLDFSEQWGTRA